eukprot:jgi/Tetstr1/462629/TSEL_007613.t1
MAATHARWMGRAGDCDSTLDVTDGAARFNADDGFLVGLPEHVWPALHAFRTSIKASVGLEVRLDKMKAYSADMEAALREAPADIEWPELDGHHGITVLNVEAFAEAVDATVLAAVERVLGVSFDPSTYGTDTNPVVTDFVPELSWSLLHDPDPMAAEVSTLSEDAVAMARNMLHLPTQLKGAGIRRMATVRNAAFIGCMNDILPSDADARVMEREVEAASGSQKELAAFLDQANNSRLRNEVCTLPVTCRERIVFHQLDAASGMWTVAIPTARTVMTPHELREVAAGYFFLPSPCLAPVVVSHIILPSTEHNPVNVDLYGDALMNLSAHGDAHWRVQHDSISQTPSAIIVFTT